MADNQIHSQEIVRSTFVKRVEWLDEIDSTNTYALRSLSKDHEFPLLIGTDKQFAGRGRGINTWWQSSGSLTCTLVLTPDSFGIAASHWPKLSLLIGLGIGSGLQSFASGSELQLKWPNDVYLDDKKVCGILIETVPELSNVLVVGFGVNVNNSLADAPDEIQKRGTSLVDLMGTTVSKQDVLISILNSLEQIMAYYTRHAESLLNDWRKHCFLSGKQVAVEAGHQTVAGLCHGIDDHGALTISNPDGIHNFFAGSVTLIDQ